MCGVFGVVSSEPVASKAIYGIYDLQHRGEQGAGIVVSNGEELKAHKGFGLVAQVFDHGHKEKVVREFSGQFGIGHTLYSTIGNDGSEKQTKAIQPLIGDFHGTEFAVAHNGNLIELDELRKQAKGYNFQSNVSDTEVIVALISTSKKKDFIQALVDILPKLRGSFSLTILFRDKVIGVRGPNGIRPLCIGRDKKSVMIASESCAFYTEGGDFVRDVKPGELVVLGLDGIEQDFTWAKDPSLNICIVEFVYFARPDSIIDGVSVYRYRYMAGGFLAEEHPAKADIVFGVPDSATIYDDAYALASNIPKMPGIFRNRYIVTRTFLTDRNTDRADLQTRKLHPLRWVVHNKKVVIVEDSVMRANVFPAAICQVRSKGATEVHARIGSSPVKYPCYLGIDMHTRVELVASSLSVEEIGKRVLQSDSIGYLSLEKMIESTGLPKKNLCLGCFIGKYPVECNKACI